MKILVVYIMTLTLNYSIAGTNECESWKLNLLKSKSDIEHNLGEAIDLNKIFTKSPTILNSKSTNVMSHLYVKGYKIDVFMDKNKEVSLSDENFNGNMVYFENKEFTIAGSIFDRKSLDVLTFEDMKILTRDMGHHKDYMKAIKNTRV